MDDRPIEAGGDKNRPRRNEDINGWKEKTEEESKKQKNIESKIEKGHTRAKKERKHDKRGLERRREHRKTEKIKSSQVNIVVKSATILRCVIKVLSSNINKEIVYHERDFSRFLSDNSDPCNDSTWIWTRQCFPLRYTTPVLSESLIASLNKS